LRDALVLDLGRVFEAAVHDRSHELGLEEKILEPGGVDSHETFLSGSGSFLLVVVRGSRFLRLLLLRKLFLLFVVNKFFFLSPLSLFFLSL
jgi:hypothetical protein